MNGFLWTMIAVFAIGILGKACFLYTQDTHRDLAYLPFDILIDAGLLAWAVWLLK